MVKSIVVVAVLAAVPALADRRAEKEARALFKEAGSLTDAGDYAGAVDMLQTAYARFPNPKILFNLAAVLELVGRHVEAAETYEKLLVQEGIGRKKADVERKLAEVEARLGRLRIDVEPPDALVSVDGKPLPTSAGPIVLRVAPGGHAVLAEKDGLKPAAETVAVEAGQERAVALTLRRIEEPVAAVPVARPPEPVQAEPAPEEQVASAVAIRAETAPPPHDLSHAGQMGVLARLDVDGTHGDGGIGLAALTWGLGLADIAIGGMLGSNKGLYVGANVFLLRGALKPLLTVGAPIFFVEGARPGVHGAAGLEWDISRHVGFLVEAGVQHYPSVPDGFDKTAFVPSAGAQGRF